jgi:hypothetical protein
MKKLLLASAAAGAMLLGGPAVANAQWSLFYGHREPAEAWWGGYPFVYAPGVIDRGCGFRTVRAIRNGQVILLAVPRC